MIHYTFGTDLWRYPQIANTMFKDRAFQFSKRLNWNVEVDRSGFEQDYYDSLNPVYVILSDDQQNHVGSVRLMPTTGRTMINDHFGDALGKGLPQNQTVWECTRFCISPTANSRTAAVLLASVGRLMQEAGVSALVAVFDEVMQRQYRLLGAPPEVFGEVFMNSTTIMAGIWRFKLELLSHLIGKAQCDPLEFEIAMANSRILDHKLRWSAWGLDC